MLDLKMYPTFLELVRITNHFSKRMIAATSRKNRNELYQPSEINCVRWVKISKTLCQSFPKFEILFYFFCHYFSEIFCNLNAAKMLLDSC